MVIDLGEVNMEGSLIGERCRNELKALLMIADGK